MHWVIQENLYNEVGFTALLSALDRLDLPYSLVKFRPFTHALEPDVNPPGKVIVVGSYSICYAAERKGWIPGAFLSENLNFEIQKGKWGGKLLNWDAVVSSLGEAELKESSFVRPVDDGKSFSGQVMRPPEFFRWRDDVLSLTPDDNPTVTEETKIMVAEPRKIYSETRCWVVRGEVVTASDYKIGTLVRASDKVDQRVIDFAAQVAEEWSPCEAYVMDIADTPMGLKIIECNNINSAGFYAADMQKLVMALEEAFS